MRRVRLISLFMMISALALGLLAWVGERGMVHPSQIQVAPLPNGQYAVGFSRLDTMSSVHSFTVGRTMPDGSVDWAPSWTGKLDGIETQPDGRMVAYSGSLTLAWDASAGATPLAEAEPMRLLPPNMRGSVTVPAAINGRVLYAWIDGNGLSMAPAMGPKEDGTPPTKQVELGPPVAEVKPEEAAPVAGASEGASKVEDKAVAAAPEPGVLDPGGYWRAEPVKVEGIASGSVSMASLQSVKGRHQLVLLESSGRAGSAGTLRVLSFELREAWEPVDAATKPASRSAESSAKPAAEPAASADSVTPSGDVPAASAPDTTASPTTPAAPENTTPTPTPPAMTQTLVRVVRAVNLKLHQITDNADRFWSGVAGDGMAIVWREPGSPTMLWRACYGANDHYAATVTVEPEGLVIAERPILVATDGGIELMVPSKVVDTLDRHRLVLIGDTAGTWTKADAIPLGRSNLPIPVETMLLLMIFAGCAGLMGMAWINVNRTRDTEAAMADMVRARVGRDTSKILDTAKPTAERIMWATMTRRGFAFLIDFIAVAPIVILVCDQTGIDVDSALNLYPLRQEYLLEGLGERLVTLSLIGVYAFTCEALWGRTLGKMVLGLRVITTRGLRPSLLAIFVRNVVRAVELCAPVTMVVALGALVFTKRNQRLGDIVAGTGIRHEVEDDDDDTSVPSE